MVLFIILLGIAAYFIISGNKQDKEKADKLDKFGVITYGRIQRVYDRSLGGGRYNRNMTDCYFYVPGKGSYITSTVLNKKLPIGDSLLIEYYPEDPNIHRFILPDSLRP